MPLKYNKSYVIKLSFCNLFEFWLVVLDKSLRLDLGKTFFFFCLLDKGQKTVKCIKEKVATIITSPIGACYGAHNTPSQPYYYLINNSSSAPIGDTVRTGGNWYCQSLCV